MVYLCKYVSNIFIICVRITYCQYMIQILDETCRKNEKVNNTISKHAVLLHLADAILVQ